MINNGPNGFSSGAFWFDIIIVQNVQNINIDVTDTIGNAGRVVGPGALYDIKQRGHIFSTWSTSVVVKGLSTFYSRWFHLYGAIRY